MNLQRRFPSAAVALSAALVLTACGNRDEGTPAAATGTTPPAATAAPATTAPVTTGSAAPKAPGPPDAAASVAGPTLPDARLTPVTGTFGAKEKKYLSGRVPEDTDPAAVLQSGQEACERVTRVAGLDRDATVAAVITGEIAGAEAAITHLCPDQLPVLEDAEGGLPDGTHTGVGPGRYRALTPGESCEWRIAGADGTVLSSGRLEEKGRTEVVVPAGAREFSSTDCYAWQRL